MGGKVPFTIYKPVLELGKDMDLYCVCMCTYNVYYLQQLMLMIFHQRYPQLQCLTLKVCYTVYGVHDLRFTMNYWLHAVYIIWVSMPYC